MEQNSMGRFADNGDGTITDTQTNLIWQKEDDGQKRTLEEAKDYCENLSLGDHNNWRLPTINELKAISAYWKSVFTNSKDDEPYWSNSVHKNPYPKASESQKYAAEVMYSSGETNQYFVIYHYYVRAVLDLSQGEQKGSDMRKCPKCGEQLEEQFEECWKCSGEQIEENISKSKEPHSPKLKRNKIIKTVVAIIGAIIWWSVVLVKNPSKLGPGITFGHLIQSSVIIIITLVIVKMIWRKKE